MSLLTPTPGQTVGPFFGYALPYDGDNQLVPHGFPGAIRLHGWMRRDEQNKLLQRIGLWSMRWPSNRRGITRVSGSEASAIALIAALTSASVNGAALGITIPQANSTGFAELQPLRFQPPS